MCAKRCCINQGCLASLVHEHSRLITTAQQTFTGEEVATEDLNQQPPPPPTHPSFRRVDEFSERGLFKVTNPLSLPAHSLQQTVSSSKLCPSEMRLHKHTQYMHKILPHTNTRTHTHDSTPYPTWLWRSSTAPPTPLSISPVWKHFKQTSTLLCYKKGKLQDMLSSIPAGLIRIVLNSHCHAF